MSANADTSTRAADRANTVPGKPSIDATPVNDDHQTEDFDSAALSAAGGSNYPNGQAFSDSALFCVALLQPFTVSFISNVFNGVVCTAVVKSHGQSISPSLSCTQHSKP